VTNNLRFPGQYFDPETGLHYNWFRYYDPGIGRYLRVDPIGFGGKDVNLYAYVWNGPVNWVDPWGLIYQTEPPPNQSRTPWLTPTPIVPPEWYAQYINEITPQLPPALDPLCLAACWADKGIMIKIDTLTGGILPFDLAISQTLLGYGMIADGGAPDAMAAIGNAVYQGSMSQGKKVQAMYETTGRKAYTPEWWDKPFNKFSKTFVKCLDIIDIADDFFNACIKNCQRSWGIQK
ncbi:MAG: RHS repeat-associated core domain-containing protein, partial [Deltaproteobacteria bacterium]|nr:RHS repeat-associated core domain-containing protein [Deltaproteobacteria bacterium]